MAKTERHDYQMGIVGNCAFMAHIDIQGRVVWLCFPHFDNSYVFGRLLDEERGGEFSVYGTAPVQASRQEYLQNTNVLQTDVKTEEGTFRIVDCAPRFVQYDRYFKPLMLIRKVEPIEGNPRVKVICTPQGDYGRLSPKTYVQSNHLRYDMGTRTIRLNTNVPLTYVAEGRDFVLHEPLYLVLTWGVPFESPLETTAEEYIRRTVTYWGLWTKHCSIGRYYQNEVLRSALTLKMHQFEDTGAIIASGTTSLPESASGGRTWDYRYCWLRDAYYTLTALSRVSQFEEMQRFANFIENIAASAPGSRYPPVVRISGSFDIPEHEIPLSGYRGYGPVRIGNQAADQVQNDIYGQIIFALLQLYVDARFPQEFKTTSKNLIMEILRIIDETMDEPDATLWEFRGFTMRHCYSTLFHWVGAKAAAKIAEAQGDHKMRRAARRLIAKSARRVEQCYNPRLKAYAQSPGSDNMDASLLHLITFHFLDPQSERATNHLKEMERQLKTQTGLFYRYRHTDDFGDPEVAFLVCAFWYVETLAVMGHIDEALETLENLLHYSNHLGLFSEDVEPVSGSQWGNFPQVYSHVGLMNAVFRITRKMDHPEFF